MTQPRYRVVEHVDEVDPEQLLAHPDNWRIHPRVQQQAVHAVIDRVGYVRSVLVNRRTAHVIDGHLRVEDAITHGHKVPVDYIDVSEDDELLLLTTLDSTTELAGRDDEKVKALIAAQEPPDDEALRLMFSRNLDTAAVIAAVSQRDDPEVENPAGPGCAMLVECSDADDRHQLMDRLRTEGYSCRPLRGSGRWPK